MAKKFKSYQRNDGSKKIRRGDRVIVLSGKSKGHVGEIIRVDHEKNKVYVEGAMVQKVSNRVAQMRNANQGGNQTGGIIEREGPIHVSNVALVDPKDNKATRVRIVREDGIRSRRAARSGQKLD
ncbi:MAG: 50S ribosomal protein L24 [Solirubrobacterales bacterium]|jgi:large subunit ribosomal protein L24|nr:50S ribosomal protein L24 [Solirubrobacterales bacterium]